MTAGTRREQNAPVRVLLLGATGYVGRKLLPALESQGYSVRCLVRSSKRMDGISSSNAEVLEGDVLDLAAVQRAMKEIDVVVYLVHAMASRRGYLFDERLAAKNVALAASAHGVRRILYLGGLAPDQKRPSPLQSRFETGEILRASGVQTVELRASLILGSGSLAFDLVSGQVDHLPVLFVPSWSQVLVQPISIGDVIRYLMAAIDIDLPGNPMIEIGGSDRVTLFEAMKEYARLRKAPRIFLPLPLAMPRLSSLWVGLSTRIYPRLARNLIGSLRAESIVRDRMALRMFPFAPGSVRTALAEAIAEGEESSCSWCDAWSSSGFLAEGWPESAPNAFLDQREAALPPGNPFSTVSKLGGKAFLLQSWVTSLVDALAGGVGFRRGRRHPSDLRVGDYVETWRVLECDPASRLRLASERRLPGRLFLEWSWGNGAGPNVRQTLLFQPRGAWGLIYWYAGLPFRRLRLKSLLRSIANSKPTEGQQNG